MFMKIFKPLFLLSIISTSLFSASYDDVFEELNTTPVSQLDFRIHKLEHRILKFKKKISAHDFDCSYSGFEFSFQHSVKICEKVNCKKDPSDLNIIVCEVFIKNDIYCDNLDIKKRFERVKYIYNTILNLAKETIHESFDKSHLRIILKIEKPLSEQDLPEKYEDLEELVISHTPQEITLVIFDNGVPYYEDAFFYK